MNNLPVRAYPEVIGQNTAALLSKLDQIELEAERREELKQSLRQLADVKFALDESSIVAVTDRAGRIQYVNDKFCEISKYSREELMHKDHRIINSGYHDKSFMKQLWNTITSGRVWRGDIKNKAKDGTYYWVHTTIVPFIDQDGRPFQFLAIRNEVTQLKEAEEQMQLMLTQMMQIQEEERRRFSRELHDGIGQSLFSLLIQLDRKIAEQEDQDLVQLRKDVSNLMEDVRGLAWEMRPSVLDDLGVVPALRTYVSNYAQHYGIHVHLDIGLKKRLDIDTETVIYRIVQESLTNIAKYAEADEAWVVLEETSEGVSVSITDRGKGFDVHQMRERERARRLERQGVGLFSMEERARGIGAQLTIGSEPGEGTVIALFIPSK